MSDDKLRELERRWKETGSVEDEAAYLLERVRAGELTRERLELVAYCGHRGAAVAIGTVGLGGNSGDLEAWAKGLSQWHEALVQAGLVAAGLALRVWDSAALNRVPGQALSEVQAWRADPTEAKRLAAEQAAEEAYLAAEPYYDAWVDEPVRGMGDAAVATFCAAKACLSTDQSQAQDLALEAVLDAYNALTMNTNRDCGSEVQEAIAAYLVEVALGDEPTDSDQGQSQC